MRRAKGQKAPLILVASWWTIFLGYIVASRAFLLREQPFILDWLWLTLIFLPILPSLYSSWIMRRISIPRAHCYPFHAGSYGTLEVSVANASRFPVPAFSLGEYTPAPRSWGGLARGAAMGLDPPLGTAKGVLLPRQTQQMRLAIAGERRGTHQAPRLRADTRFPFSFFTTWKTFYPQGEYVVYPEPELGAPAWPDTLEHGSRKVRRGEDVVGFRGHHHDDPLNIVDWKASAKTGSMVVREYQDQDSVLHFDWAQVAGLPTEQAISRLTSWILMADSQGRAYCLDLPGAQGVPAGAGDTQKHLCLTALADYKRAP